MPHPPSDAADSDLERAVDSLLADAEQPAPTASTGSAAPPPAAPAAPPSGPNPMLAVAAAVLDAQGRPVYSDFASVPTQHPFGDT